MATNVKTKYKFFTGRAAWTVVGSSVCKAGVIKHNENTCFDVAHTRYVTNQFHRVYGWKSDFIDWI